MQGNKSFWAKERDDIASKLWAKVSFFRVEGGASEDVSIKAIKSLENKD